MNKNKNKMSAKKMMPKKDMPKKTGKQKASIELTKSQMNKIFKRFDKDNDGE